MIVTYKEFNNKCSRALVVKIGMRDTWVTEFY